MIAARHVLLSPLTRLILLSVVGLALLLAMALVAMQPATGWTWSPAEWRPVADVHPAVWVSLGTGLLAWLISAWVWALKPAAPAAVLFAASGLATLTFCFASFAPRIALPMEPGVVAWIWRINMLGASAFGVIMTCLFLIYPSRLRFWKPLAAAVVVVFGLWTLLRTFGPFQDLAEVQRITTFEMVAIVMAVVWQVRASADDPRLRAIALWLGASTLLGAGAFIVTVAAPLTFGFDPLVLENYAFSFFLVIYVGLAVGLMRYRLFDLGAWAYRLVFYASAALALIVLDIALASLLALDPGEALGVSLIVVAVAYLPLRDILWRRMVRRRPADADGLFHLVLDAALKPTAQERATGWSNLLRDHFNPLEMVEIPEQIAEAEIGGEGLVLKTPGVAGAPAFRLMHANNGRSLFTPRDAGVVTHLVRLMQQAEASRSAYDRGVSEERLRIARDIHDNIGAQLMRALHSTKPDRKDAMIRDTLADLRDVINNAQSPALPLDAVLADLRAETADRLEPHGVSLRWSLQADAGLVLTPSTVHALRSVIREAASNTIKHAGATRLGVSLQITPHRVEVVVEDDGSGFDIETVKLGQGLANMKARVEGVGGAFALSRGETGAQLQAHFPHQAAAS
ncbi:MAG: histidine kinase [Hyphomonadaceae bacterium]